MLTLSLFAFNACLVSDKWWHAVGCDMKPKWIPKIIFDLDRRNVTVGETKSLCDSREGLLEALEWRRSLLSQR
jgi:hypothetical protein